MKKQCRIHGNPVADGWAGAVIRKPLGIQKCYLRTDRHGKVQSRVSATKKSNKNTPKTTQQKSYSEHNKRKHNKKYMTWQKPYNEEHIAKTQHR